MLIKTSEERYVSSLCTLKYHFFDLIMQDVRRFEALSVLDDRPNEHFNLYSKHVSRKHCKRVNHG